MFSRLCILIALTAGGVLATPADPKTPFARQTPSGTATVYSQNGKAGACGKVHNDNDHIVALQAQTYANGAHCGATITITDKNTGVTATGIVADECHTCSDPGSIALSDGLFEVFAPVADGAFPVSWHF